MMTNSGSRFFDASGLSLSLTLSSHSLELSKRSRWTSRQTAGIAWYRKENKVSFSVSSVSYSVFVPPFLTHLSSYSDRCQLDPFLSTFPFNFLQLVFPNPNSHNLDSSRTRKTSDDLAELVCADIDVDDEFTDVGRSVCDETMRREK